MAFGAQALELKEDDQYEVAQWFKVLLLFNTIMVACLFSLFSFTYIRTQ